MRSLARRGIDPVDLEPEVRATRSVRLLDKRHAKQHRAFSDPSRKIGVLAGRGAGKTGGAVRWLVEGALQEPRTMSPFIGLSRDEAKKLAWDELKTIDEKHRLGFTFNDSELVATAPNRSKIWVSGADKRKDIRKFRGFPIKRAVVEECGAQGPHLEELVEEVLEPRTVDVDGQIALLGTPNAACAGYFFDVTTGRRRGWSNHTWTMLDNPFLPRAKAWLKKKIADMGWATDHPVLLREYFARWVRSLESLVYAFDEERNLYTALPPNMDWHYVLGIDVGLRDATAYVVWAWCRDLPELYEVACIVDRDTSTATISQRLDRAPSRIARRIKVIREHFKLHAAVMDTGGLGKVIIERLMERHTKELGSLQIEAPEKQGKRAHIDEFNDDARRGLIKVRKGSPLVEEWKLLQWDETGLEEDSRFENHASDAGLYGSLKARHFRHKPKETGPVEGSPEWERQQELALNKKLEKRRKERLRNQRESRNSMSKASRSW